MEITPWRQPLALGAGGFFYWGQRVSRRSRLVAFAKPTVIEMHGEAADARELVAGAPRAPRAGWKCSTWLENVFNQLHGSGTFSENVNDARFKISTFNSHRRKLLPDELDFFLKSGRFRNARRGKRDAFFQASDTSDDHCHERLCLRRDDGFR